MFDARTSVRFWTKVAISAGGCAEWTGHPTPKPMKLMREIVGRVATDAAFILDPFCGSGTTLRAAQEAGRRAIGIEIEEQWCEAAARRLEDVVPAPREQQQMFAGVEL